MAEIVEPAPSPVAGSSFAPVQSLLPFKTVASLSRQSISPTAGRSLDTEAVGEQAALARLSAVARTNWFSCQ
ncbi:hypothetical protein M2171_003595 [Bradyrhizobium japonicum USDA 38]|nr:hypothetical protein [Bradyrhizobium japonicum USDA 38]MCS3946976.1 hypothetical protein [Bradyrhizobium japonicum]MCW2220194.1 hypothetical protein [Bradyrhizobium japonicum]MCW2344807.1 hypothetical protein [Bradyrhizobium japonicum]